MRKIVACVVASIVLLSLAPVGADPGVSVGYGAWRSYFTEIYQRPGAPVEVWIQAGTSETLATSEQGDPEEEDGNSGACISLFSNNLLDEACGPLTMSSDPLLDRTVVAGTLESTACDYVNGEHGPSFENCRPSTIELRLSIAGSGDLTPAHSERSGIITCGLPPDIRGGGAQQELAMRRDGTPTGLLASAELGAVDLTTVDAKVYGSTMAYAVGCVEGLDG